jgi:hypothetical protein
MSAEWKAELKKLKQPLEEKKNMSKQKAIQSSESDLKELMRLLKSQLKPVVEVFREGWKTRTQQPHLHEHDDGYTLVVPVVKEGIDPVILRLLFRFKLTENGYLLKVIGETEKNMPAPEKTIGSPITAEKIRDEIREFLKKRQSIILNLKKGA